MLSKALQGGLVGAEANRAQEVRAEADPNESRTSVLWLMADMTSPWSIMLRTIVPRKTTLRTIAQRKTAMRRTTLGRTMLSKTH